VSGSAQWGLQQAVYARLSGDATLTSTLGADVYDETPQDAAYPYVVIGEDTELPDDTMGVTGRSMTLVLHYWSQYPGAREVKQVHARVDALLDRWTPTVAGWSLTETQFEFFEIVRDPDGITRHGIARYRVHAKQG
jgi:hypothetical protein